MTNSATPLSIVKELRRLAQNPCHREYLLCNDVNSILIFVDPDDQSVEVVTEAINALFYLAEEASQNYASCTKMRSTTGLVSLMKKIEERDGYSIECKALAIKIQRLLNESHPASPISPRADSIITRSRGARSSGRSMKFLGETRKAKIITLQIVNLTNQERRKQCIDALVKVKGVISLTFNMALHRCVIRAKQEVSPETLSLAVSSTKVMEASQVVKNDDGEEVLLSFHSKVNDSVGGDLPSYLEEDPVESPHKSDHAVARPNSSRGIASIAGSWFGNVLNAVNKNLYW